MIAPIAYLCPRESVRLDPARIGFLYAELGSAQLQQMLDRAMAEFSHLHEELCHQYAQRDLPGLARNLRRLHRISDHLGLTTVARVADDVSDCLLRGDSTALSATWARLSRSADQARQGNWHRV